MVTVNKEDELLKKCSYVVISSYRRKVLETLKNDVKIPTKISEESGVGIKHVSNVLTDLKEHNLIVCINEDAHKGRLYRLTEEGKNVVDMIGKINFNKKWLMVNKWLNVLLVGKKLGMLLFVIIADPNFILKKMKK